MRAGVQELRRASELRREAALPVDFSGSPKDYAVAVLCPTHGWSVACTLGCRGV